jgi:ATP-binding cassette subfamily B protein
MVTTNLDLYANAWHPTRLSEAIELLARKRNLLPQAEIIAPSVPRSLNLGDDATIEQWMTTVAAELKIEIEPIAITYAEIEQFIARSAPALVQLPMRAGDTAPYFLAIQRAGKRVALLGSDYKTRQVSADVVRNLMCEPLERKILRDTDAWLEHAGASRRDVARARRTIAHEALIRNGMGAAHVGKGWIVLLSPGADLWRQARHEKMHWSLLKFLGIDAAQKGIELGAWVMMGLVTLSGTIETAWLSAWAMLLLTGSLLRVPNQLVRGEIRRKTMGIKQWLIYNALKLDPDTIRHQGVGQFLGSIMASGTLEDRVGNVLMMVLVALVELLMLSVMLAFGAGGWLHAGLLYAWTAFLLLMCWQIYRYGKEWNATYHHMASDLVERMVGHRTRLAQEERAKWHIEEDAILAHYVEQSEHLDGIEAQVKALTTRGWMVIGVLGIAYPYVTTQIALDKFLLSVGGILLVSQTLSELVGSALTLVRGMLAWQQVASLVRTADTTIENAERVPLVKRAPPPPEGNPAVLIARNVVFRFYEHGRIILDQCNLRIQSGDRLLLEGPSGGGKSTLASLLAGLRKPESGLLLLRGYDRQTLGADEWRSKVVIVPQFHENHIFTETFGFNLLMGRRWPPTTQDLAMAEMVCRELGLGDLLDRMPAKFDQPVGERGWQLSHGERSRLFIARALLQDADVIILDETFGTLDPENLQRAMNCVLQRAPTLMVIAHP